MPRSTATQMRPVLPVLSDAPGTREMQGVQGVRADGTFERTNADGPWFDVSALHKADATVEAMLASNRQKLGIKPAKAPLDALPLPVRMAQAQQQKAAEMLARDGLDDVGPDASDEKKLQPRRTTQTLDELEPEPGLLKRLLRRGGQHGRSKK